MASCPFLSSADSPSTDHSLSVHSLSHENLSASTSSTYAESVNQRGSKAASARQPPWLASLPPLMRSKLQHQLAPPGRVLLPRRHLRQQHREFTLEEVAQHRYVNDIWIAVDGQVYDITDHLINHHGWHEHTAGITTPLSILAHAGTDCSEEFHALHRSYPKAYKQLAMHYIGPLAK